MDIYIGFIGTSSSNAIWVSKASGTIFSNIKFSNINYEAKPSSDSSKNGIIVAEAKGRMNYNNVTVEFCEELTKDNSIEGSKKPSNVIVNALNKSTSFGTLFADANLSKDSSISGISITNGKFDFKVGSSNDSYIGLYGGKITANNIILELSSNNLSSETETNTESKSGINAVYGEFVKSKYRRYILNEELASDYDCMKDVLYGNKIST